MMPAIVSQLITLIKDTSLAFIIAVPEVVGAGRSFFNFYGNPVETYVALALLFFAINFPLSLVSRRLEARQPADQRVRVGARKISSRPRCRSSSPRRPHCVHSQGDAPSLAQKWKGSTASSPITAA